MKKNKKMIIKIGTFKICFDKNKEIILQISISKVPNYRIYAL
jgi:hypothetical protein